jgi:DMSO reductase family type II enzyme chaperone
MTEQGEIVPIARSNIYRFLALGFGYPDASFRARLSALLPRIEASLNLVGDRDGLTAAIAMGSVLDTQTTDHLQASYLECFGHTISKECPPYETEYGQAHIFEKSQSLADIAGFYRAFGVDLAPDLNDRLDHISVELEFMQLLCAKEAYALAHGHSTEKLALCRDAQSAFLGQHLGCWALGFAGRLRHKAGPSLHGLAAELLQAFLRGEGQRMAVAIAPEAMPIPRESFEEDAAGCQACTAINPAAFAEQGQSP